MADGYKTARTSGGLFYYYDVPGDFYTGSDRRTRLYAATPESLEQKILIYESKLKAMRIEAFRYVKDFDDLYALYGREHMSPLKRGLFNNYRALLTKDLPIDLLPAADDYLKAFENNASGRSKEQLRTMHDIYNDICTFSADYGIPYVYPKTQVEKFIDAYIPTKASGYTVSEWQTIRDALMKEGSDKHNHKAMAFIILFLCEGCICIEKITYARWKDFEERGDGIHFIFEAEKNRGAIQVGINDILLSPDLTGKLYGLDRRISEGTDTPERAERPPEDSIFPVPPTVTASGKYLKKLLKKLALPDNTSPEQFAKLISRL
jgi:hypothetical protein